MFQNILKHFGRYHKRYKNQKKFWNGRKVWFGGLDTARIPKKRQLCSYLTKTKKRCHKIWYGFSCMNTYSLSLHFFIYLWSHFWENPLHRKWFPLKLFIIYNFTPLTQNDSLTLNILKLYIVFGWGLIRNVANAWLQCFLPTLSQRQGTGLGNL